MFEESVNIPLIFHAFGQKFSLNLVFEHANLFVFFSTSGFLAKDIHFTRKDLYPLLFLVYLRSRPSQPRTLAYCPPSIKFSAISNVSAYIQCPSFSSPKINILFFLYASYN